MRVLQSIKRAGLAALLLTVLPARADIDLGSLDLLSSANPSSPVPRGLVGGAVLLGGQARYQAQDNILYPIPGFLYFGEQFMYLGDRTRYYLHKDERVALYGYGRVRFGNLDPADEPAFTGMDERKGQLEGGIGGNLITPYALLTVRASSDISGRSKGQELLLWADFPILRDKLLIMPGMGLMLRSDKLANYYFGGISESEATAQRPAWDTGSTLSPMAALITSYRFSPNWIGMFAMNYEWYDGDIEHSPLVQHTGELYAGVGIGYIW
ncbi:TPA: MipA/OmpV family protein [Aeromonas hydrophila]|uniref:MipA/OmpV family protein n=1 Tax=Aeromonas hydrophila TaxID=644 RepID=UPI00227A62D4|nr:MipA/OmpV family protein [Aeromonas hydrophila]WAF92171.1 MipA/OmpV family protein [Aeromonas hydrophila]WAG04897.1 MipA/OmpV family protein [Aeromonas hydrophila]